MRPWETTWSPQEELEVYLRDPAAYRPILPPDFAFVLCDRANQRALLARAPLRSVPLFYAVRNGAVVFADSPRLILKQLDSSPILDEEGLRNWLSGHPHQDEHTFFAGISRVLPGTVVTVRHDGSVSSHVTWSPLEQPLLHLKSEEEYSEALRVALKRAVRESLQPGVTFGATLSGGLDSSSVTSIAAPILKEWNASLYAITGVPGDAPAESSPDRFANEGAWAAEVAAMYPNIQHIIAPGHESSFLEVADRWSDAEQAPVLNPHHCLWYEEVFSAAQQVGAEVMLGGFDGNHTISYSGDGAIASLIRQGRYIDTWRLARAYRTREGTVRFPPRTLLRMAACAISPGIAALYQKRRLAGHFPVATPVRHGFAVFSPHPPAGPPRQLEDTRSERLFHLQRVDTALLMQGIARRFGVTLLDPTGDRRLVEFCLSIPEEFFAWKGESRSLLRAAMKGILPERVRTETRRGLQGAANLEYMMRQQKDFAEEFKRMREVPVLQRALDLDLLISQAEWPRERILGARWPAYVTQMTRYASVGRFVRRMAEHTLFNTIADQPIALAD